MSVEVALAPRHKASLAAGLRAVYTPGTRLYHHFLTRGQFDRLYAPSSAERSAVGRYLAGAGLRVTSTSSPFLIRVTGVGPRQQAATNNGVYPTTPGYDEATGAGTPKMGRDHHRLRLVRPVKR
jgi:pseudomonalisin